MYRYLRAAERAGIFTHINPDGDALGSTTGLMGFLDYAGKDSVLFLPTPVSDTLKFIIPGKYSGRIFFWNDSREEELRAEISRCDLLVGLDFNTMERIGNFGRLYHEAKSKKILIDHHVGPQTEEFDAVYSDTLVSSACELLYRLLLEDPALEGDIARIGPDACYSLMTGMTTDTNNFANSVFPGTLEMASDLLRTGVDREDIIEHILHSYPERRLRAQGYALSELMRVTPEGVAYIILDRATQIRFGLREGETEGFVNMPLDIASVRLSILLKEELDSPKIRVSLRSKKGTSARDVAMQYFHGGGHVQASGGKLIQGEDIKDIGEAAEYIEKIARNLLTLQPR